VSTVNIDELVENLSKLTVIQMAELKKALELKWGVKAQAAAVAVAAPAAASAGASEAASESTEFKVTLEEAPQDKKIAIIKVVREITGLGLKEAKDIVEAVPKVLKDSAPKADAEEMIKKLKEAGAKASLKGL
jgi:large subunit ribosomal protein L7/L12